MFVNQTLRTQEGVSAAAINVIRREENIIIEFGLPLLVDLTSPINIEVDNKGLAEYAYNTCNTQACFIVRNNDKTLMNSFIKGKSALINAKSYSGQNIKMNISLNGFGAALAALKKN